MNSRFYMTTRTVWVLCLLGFLVSCQDTIPYRSTITPGSNVGTPTCTEDQELVEETVDGEKILVCKDKAIVRPNNAVFWKADFCACKDTKAVSLGNCASFCSTKNTGGAETLFANFTVSEDISLGGLGSVYGWCKTPLEGDTQNPECELQAKDESGNISYLDVNISQNSNSISANIQDKLSYDKTYILTLVEKGSKAQSNSVQLVKISPDLGIPVLGPLKNVPVTQYTCMVREYSEDQVGNVYFDTAYRLHFYFIPNLPPKPIPAGNGNLICHDIFNPLYGKVDDVLYPRFEQLPAVFNLWDTMDPRFYDNNNNGALDANESIIQKTRNFGGTIPTGTNFFQKFSWPGAPQLEDDSGSSTTQPLGYFMAPWIDQSTFKSYCLNSTHYNSTNPLFKAMRDVLQVDTEGIYIGEKAPEAVTLSDGTQTTGLSDYILIRETDLKQVWFHVKNGSPTAPTDAEVASVAVYFYYPLNKLSPFVRTSTQRIYQVKSAAELNASNGSNENSSNGSTSTGGTTTYPPHDRKIGCIPKF